MTKASATKVLSISTSTTTKTTVSAISRYKSRGSRGFFSLALAPAAGCAPACPLGSTAVVPTGRVVEIRSSAMYYPNWIPIHSNVNYAGFTVGIQHRPLGSPLLTIRPLTSAITHQ